jgi:hypothetical protein
MSEVLWKKKNEIMKRRQMGPGPKKMAALKIRRNKTKAREQRTINKKDHGDPKWRSLLE